MRKVPAIVDCVTEASSLQIAGLSLLDRLIVTAHRAGSAPIYLIAKTTPAVLLLVLLLALVGKLDLFIWMAGIGVHLFWIIALCSQWRDAGRAPAISENPA